MTSYHVVASEEGVDGVQVVVKQLRHTVDDVEGDGLQDVHHLHVLACNTDGKTPVSESSGTSACVVHLSLRLSVA